MPLLCLSFFLALALGVAAAPAKKILFFTKSSNFEHSVIKERAGNLSFAAQVLKELGPPHGIEFVLSRPISRKSRRAPPSFLRSPGRLPACRKIHLIKNSPR